MNKQEIFDKVAVAVLGQGKRSFNEGRFGPACVYQDRQGNKCAVGHLLPEGHKGFEHQGDVEELFSMYPDLMDHFGVEYDDFDLSDPDFSLSDYDDVKFLMELQDAHDSSCDVEFEGSFKNNMGYVARSWGLSEEKVK